MNMRLTIPGVALIAMLAMPVFAQQTQPQKASACMPGKITCASFCDLKYKGSASTIESCKLFHPQSCMKYHGSLDACVKPPQ